MSDEEPGVDASLASPSIEPPPPHADEREPVLAALASGDREQVARSLVSEHAHAIGRICMALLGSQSEAEDALQETLVDALAGLHAFRGEDTLRAWLLSIARKRCAKRLGKRTRERDSNVGLAGPETSVNVERLSMAARARRLLAEIRPTERDALVLRFGAELSFRDVGLACGIDEATARQRVSRGLARLRSLLGEDKS